MSKYGRDFISRGMMSTALVPTRLAHTKPLVVSLVLSGLLMASSLGCRSARDNQIDILERELRKQEDYIYELEDYVLEYSEKLRDVRCAVPSHVVTQAKPIEPELVPAEQDDQPIEEPSLESLPEPVQPEPEPEVEEPAIEEPEEMLPEDLDIPDLDLESAEPVSQQDVPRDTSQVEAVFESDDEQFYVQDDAIELTAAEDESIHDEHATEAEFLEKLFEEDPQDHDYRNAERLEIIGVYRGTQDEELLTSLLTVIEARDTNDEPVDLDGKVSLMIMTADPVSPQRLKRWDFNSEETASAWQSSQLGDGLHLELPIEGAIESEESMELWVRLVAADGRKLLAQLPLPIEELVTVEEAMEGLPDTLADDVQLAESKALPLQPQDSEQEQPTDSDVASVESKVKPKSGTQWRASTHQSAKGYATTSKAAKGWKSQPAGGREPRSRMVTSSQSTTAVRQATTQQPHNRPVWTAGRNMPSAASSDQPRPQWAPPK